MVKARRAALVVMAVLLVPDGAHAREFAPPMRLPGAGASAAGTRDWLIGVRPGTPLPAGARRLRAGTIVVARGRARSVAARLRRSGDLVYAEPDPPREKASVMESNPGGYARGLIVRPSLAWPGSGPIGVIDSFVDSSVPDLAGQVSYLNATATSTIDDSHGTEVASAAAASFGNGGLMGVLPGAPIVSWGVDYDNFTCGESAKAIGAMVRARVKVVNLSYGSPRFCYTEYLAAQEAFGIGTLLVAAAGNEFQEGNPVGYPAAFPHVMSVAAVDRKRRSANFSTRNAAVDISAPGVGVPLVTPLKFDTEDGAADGFVRYSGTSYSAPMVAGAAAWMRAQHPRAFPGQIADLLRFSARDIDDRGYDKDTGWGLVDIKAALSRNVPFDDPLEPNDDIAFVSGAVFAEPDRPVWDGNGREVLYASADPVEDPLDVYRYLLEPRSEVRITLSNRFGDADLQVFDAPARSTSSRRQRICRSQRRARHRDVCFVHWDYAGKRVGYVAVNSASINAGYTLRFARIR